MSGQQLATKRFVFLQVIVPEYLFNISCALGNLEVGNTESKDNDENTGTWIKALEYRLYLECVVFPYLKYAFKKKTI